MPVSPQVEQDRDSALSSAESALAVIGRPMQLTTGPGREKSAPQKRARHSAWSGLIKIVCFFCLILILLFGLNALINAGLRRIKTSQFGVSNKIVQGKINAEIVISGSSRALSHYDPRIIERITGYSTFNIGLNGSQTDMQLARLKAYLNHNQQPKLLIQNLDLYYLCRLPTKSTIPHSTSRISVRTPSMLASAAFIRTPGNGSICRSTATLSKTCVLTG